MPPRIVVAYSYYANLIAITSYRVAGYCAAGSTDSRSTMQMVLIQYCRFGYQKVGRLLKLGLNHNDGVCRVRCSRLPAAHTGDQLELAGFVSGQR
jgi:hypothetical protein